MKRQLGAATDERGLHLSDRGAEVGKSRTRGQKAKAVDLKSRMRPNAVLSLDAIKWVWLTGNILIALCEKSLLKKRF